MSENMEIRFGDTVKLELGNTIPVPVRDYLLMINKPSINGQVLEGNLVIKLGDLENDAGYLTEETDPTVPAWAKQPNKPTYTAQEVGAMPSTVVIPVRLSQLTDDVGYYIKPVGGIPLSDLVPGIIPDFSSKLDTAQKGAPGGVAELDQNGMVPPHQLPSYVDNVDAFPSIAMFPTIGESDKIYIDKSTNKQYRWSGDATVGYVPIGSSLAIGETAHTAYRGDRGKVAYDHAMAKGEAFVSGLYKIETNDEGHIVSAIPVVKADITALGIPGEVPTSPVQDVRFNNASILQDGIANVNSATSAQVKEGTNSYSPITPNIQHESVFYALAKIAGHDEKNSGYVAGGYSPGAKHAILNMLGLSQLITDWLDVNPGDLAPKAITKDSYFVMSGWVYKATQNIAKDALIIENTNCVNTRIGAELSNLYNIKADKTDTVLLTTLSNGRKANTTVGSKSIAWGLNAEASGDYAVAIGNDPQATAEGAAAFGYGSKANGQAAFAAGYYAKAIGANSFAHGNWTEVNGRSSHAGGDNTVVNGDCAFGNGYYLVVNGKYQNVIGIYNYPNGDEQHELHAADLPEWEMKDYRYGEAVKYTENGVATIYVAHMDVPEILSPLNDPYNIYWRVIESGNIPNPELVPEWDPEGTYEVGDQVKQYYAGKTYYFSCNSLHPPVYVAVTNGTFWHPQAEGSTSTVASKYLEMVGNGHGSKETRRSNARMLDVYGNEYLMGDVYVKCGANGDNGKKLITADDIPTVPVTDVQIDGTSILENGVATIPIAINNGSYGLVKVTNGSYGVTRANDGYLMISSATDAHLKAGNTSNRPVVPNNQHTAIFYGFSKLAGVDLANVQNVTVGIYPQSSKTAIQTMLGIEADIPLIETVSGGTPSITGLPNVRYICSDTVSTLSLTPPASGTMVVRFHSGSTATVLTVPNTVVFPVWFDETSLDTYTTYEIIITDGVYGGVMSWAD